MSGASGFGGRERRPNDAHDAGLLVKMRTTTWESRCSKRLEHQGLEVGKETQ